jgi:Restriction endonuclease
MMKHLSFDHLSDTNFEKFTFDLLDQLKFVNIDWRKGTGLKTSPADRGRDIVAHQARTDVDKSRHLERWFVDCKHHKRGVPPTELQNLLTWSESERPDVALFVVSNFLSNASKDYLENYRRNNRPPFKIKYWENPQLERMAKVRLIRKYDLADIPIRSVRQILKAEEEFFDRIWYDRKLLLQANVIEGREKEPPRDIKRGIINAMKEVEAKYGGKAALRNYYKNDFEWGMMNGKLSALRWVLGDDWDMLDT